MNPQDLDPLQPPDDDRRETELRRLFAERERRDEASAPGYERLARTPAGPERPARTASQRWRAAWAPWAAAGALLALLALVVLWRIPPAASPSRSHSLAEQPTLETWRSPTDFLLAVPGRELLDSTPAFPDPHLPTLPGGS